MAFTWKQFQSVQATILYHEFENYTFKITATSFRGHWDKETVSIWSNTIRISSYPKCRIYVSTNQIMACHLFSTKPLSQPMLELLSIGHLGTMFSEILLTSRTFSFKKIRFKMLSGKWQPFCLSLNVYRSTINYTTKSWDRREMWGSLKNFAFFHYFSIFSPLSKH